MRLIRPSALREEGANAGVSRALEKYPKATLIFSQGDVATQVMYMKRGTVKISVLSCRRKRWPRSWEPRDRESTSL